MNRAFLIFALVLAPLVVGCKAVNEEARSIRFKLLPVAKKLGTPCLAVSCPFGSTCENHAALDPKSSDQFLSKPYAVCKGVPAHAWTNSCGVVEGEEQYYVYCPQLP